VCGSGRFYPHYFDLLVPALAIAAAPVVAALLAGEGPAGGPWPLRPVSMRRALGVTAVAFFALQTRARAAPAWQRRGPPHQDDRGARRRGVRLGRAAARLPRRGPAPGHALRGHLPAHGLALRRRDLVRSGLSDTTSRIVPGTWETFERELRASRPRFFVDVEASSSCPAIRSESSPGWRATWRRNYKKVHEAKDGIVYERISRL
jgi:hypothetical protein